MSRRQAAIGVAVLTAATGALLFCAPAAQRSDDGRDLFDPMAAYTDWQPQDYEDSQAVQAVRREDGRLRVDGHFIGRDQSFAKGEVFIDLRYVAGLEDQTPIDMTNRAITATVRVPEGFAGYSSAPNGVQVFVKDAQNRCQYGTWENIAFGGTYEVSLRPSTRSINWGYTAEGFDPTCVTQVGVKFAVGSQSGHRYDGTLYVDAVSIDPPLVLTEQPLGTATAPTSAGSSLDSSRDFVVGGNWRIIEYGQDFGGTKWFPTGNGVSKHANYVRASLNLFRRAGIGAVRVVLLADGRTMLDKEGHVGDGPVVGYTNVFRNDVRTFLDLAAEQHVKVEFVLLDYLLAGRAALVDGVWVRGRGQVITDPGLREEFLRRFLVPFLGEFGSAPAIMAFDLMNEPEWIVSKQDGGGWEDVKDAETKCEQPVPGEAIREFWEECARAIHQLAPGKLVTVGVSCPNVKLVEGLPLDYYALHHYPWMDNPAEGRSMETYAASLPAGKPWMLEEYPTHNASLSITEYLDRTIHAGARGAMLWNLRPQCDSGPPESQYSMLWQERRAKLNELRTWVQRHAPPTADTGERAPAARPAGGIIAPVALQVPFAPAAPAYVLSTPSAGFL